MSQAMNMLEEGMTKGLRYQRTENRSGGITEERSVAEHVSLNAKSRRRPESLYLGAMSLLLSKVKRRERRSHRKNGSGGGGERQRRWRSRQGISDDIGHPSSVADGEVELRKKGQLALLAGRLGNGGAGQGGNKRLVISEQSERTALEEVTVVEERGIDGLELTIKSGVALLRRCEFGREKGEGLPGPLDLLLENRTDV